MTSFSRDEALKVYWAASPAVRQVILDEARANISARQAAMIALEQRLAQAGAALFAAAAFSATFAVTFRDASIAFAFLGGLATIAFTTGAVATLSGMRAGDIIFPGSSISWWSGCEFLDEVEADQARYWVAGQLEQVLESYDLVARRRAKHLNCGLMYAAAGGFFVGLAGCLSLFA